MTAPSTFKLDGGNAPTAAMNHAAFFQYGPAAAAQLEAVLGPGGMPTDGANNVTS